FVSPPPHCSSHSPRSLCLRRSPLVAPPALLLRISSSSSNSRSSSSVRRSQVVFPLLSSLVLFASSLTFLPVLQLGQWRGGGSVFGVAGEAFEMAQ
uniref:Uncharacterized protein n=1 Tax=Triticum urartu TaxID=4572 RepID=A0A8R7V2I4_TRIUA